MNDAMDNPDDYVGLQLSKAELERREKEHYDNGFAAGWHAGYAEGQKHYEPS